MSEGEEPVVEKETAAGAEGGGTGPEPAGENAAKIKAIQDKKALLKEQTAMLTAQKELQDAQKALLTSQKQAIAEAFPTGEAQAPAGTITTSEAGYLAELVAYQTLKDAAQAIGQEIDGMNLAPDPAGKARILIVSGRDLAQGDLPLLQLDGQFTRFKEVLQKQIVENEALLAPPEADEVEAGWEAAPPALVAGAALPIAEGLISSVADIVGYFRSNYTLTGRTVQLGYDGLSAVVAGQVRRHEVYIQDFCLIEDSTIVTRLGELIGLGQDLERTKELLKTVFIPMTTETIATWTGEISTLESEIQQLNAETDKAKIAEKQTTLEGKKGSLKEKNALLAAANQAVVESESRIKALGDYVTQINTAPNAETPSPLAQAALRQQIRAQGISHVLYLSVLSEGGEMITRTRLWRSGEVAYIGGCALQYVLATSAGRVVAGDTRVGMSQLKCDLGQLGNATIKPVSFG